MSVAAAPDSARASPWGGRGLLVAYAGAILYASLNPFHGWRLPEAILLFSWPRYWSGFDLALNVLAYVPLGALLAGHYARTVSDAGSSTRIALRALAMGTLWSVAMELLQTLLPQRVSSPADVAANAGGVLGGALMVLSGSGRWLQARMIRARNRWLVPARRRDLGLLLCVAWLFAQLNPLVPLFDAGEVVPRQWAHAALDASDPVLLLPVSLGILLNACAFALFLSLVLRPGRRLVAGVAGMIALGFVLKAVMAALMLRTPQFAAWLSPAAVTGVAAGLGVFVAIRRLTLRWRALAAALSLFAGGLLARLADAPGALDTAIKLLHWPYGHVATFAGLTHWVYEAWPLAAFCFAAGIFLAARPVE
ncbi:MAG: VanZ family protein [Betaproteobacteria bacterium]|nr:VanZ family protein [Betaproteobacteria bacterium]